MIPYIRRPTPQQKPRIKEEDDCTIEVKRTKTGKKIRISGKCRKEDVQLLMQDRGENAT